MRIPTLVTVGAGSIIAGVILGTTGVATPFVVMLSFGAALAAGIVFVVRRWPLALSLAVVLCMLAVGMGRFGIADAHFQAQPFVVLRDTQQTVRGIIQHVDRRATKTFVVVDDPRGAVRVTFPAGVGVTVDDTIVVAGELRDPGVIDDFDYRAFLRTRDIVGVMMRPVILHHQQNSAGGIAGIRTVLRAGLEQTIRFPESSLAAAMTLGETGLLPDDLEDVLVHTGTRHIVAISGLHMVLLAEILIVALTFFGLWRRSAVLVAGGILAGFVMLVGAPASAVRALIFVSVLEAARAIGRPGRGLRLIVIAGAAMAVWNPFLPRWDVGFQLSFLAVVGIAYGTPLVQRWVQWIPGTTPRRLTAMTIGALLTTLPVVATTFGRVSLVAPLGNILAVPLLPAMVTGSLSAAIIGAVMPTIGAVAGLPVWGLLWGVRHGLTLLGALPFAAVRIAVPGTIALVWEAVVVAVLIWQWRKRTLPRWRYANE